MTSATKTTAEKKMMAAFETLEDYTEMTRAAAAQADALHAEGETELRDEWVRRAQSAAAEARDAHLRVESAVLEDRVPVAVHQALRQRAQQTLERAREAAARSKQLLG